MKHFLKQLRRVKLREILDVWKLILAIVPAIMLRLRYPDLWIVCEDENEARDNGYWFFKYVREHHPSQRIIYAIKSASPDYGKVRRLGWTVEHGSFMHYVYYLASSKKISSQKSGNPNPALFYFLEVYGILKDKRVFLQHGVTINNAKWLYYDVTRMNRFICGAYPEYEYISSVFGYPEKNVCYTGFCRFDNLHDHKTEKIILVMPTWREWIADEDYRLKLYEGTEDIPKTNYFRMWTDFINSPEIPEICEKYGYRFIFFPHRNMQKYLEYFPKGNEYISIMTAKNIDIQELLRKSAVMITDYSSVCFDFIYMKKPLIFYQFDYDMFRKGQYGEGYFDYRNNPFAKSFPDKKEVFKELDRILGESENIAVSEEYLKAHKEHFRKYDRDNCKRVFDVVKNL